MALFQCFYFFDGVIREWENIECSGEESLKEFLIKQLVGEIWDAAEAWRHDTLVCRVEQLPGGVVDCSPDCPMRTSRAASPAQGSLA
jgi:hypothetical protein